MLCFFDFFHYFVYVWFFIFEDLLGHLCHSWVCIPDEQMNYELVKAHFAELYHTGCVPQFVNKVRVSI